MKEYITKDRAKQFVCGHCNEVCSEKPCEPSDCDWMAFIDKEPAADVVEVVRCKDCLYSKERYGHMECIRGVSYRNTWNKPDFFCSYGERKEGVNNG